MLNKYIHKYTTKGVELMALTVLLNENKRPYGGRHVLSKCSDGWGGQEGNLRIWS